MCYANVLYPISFYLLWEERNSALLVASESSLLWGQVLSESSLKLKGLSDNFLLHFPQSNVSLPICAFCCFSR